MGREATGGLWGAVRGARAQHGLKHGDFRRYRWVRGAGGPESP